MENKDTIYNEIFKNFQSLLTSKHPLKPITIYSNLVIIIKKVLTKASWVGFYFINETKDGMDLGPYSGDLACNYIDINRGVCGQAARLKKTIIVENVKDVPFHIACDALSQSEIVVPLIINKEVIALLDIDSHEASAFDKQDQNYLEKILLEFEKYLTK